jgi:hypothetical protein
LPVGEERCAGSDILFFFFIDILKFVRCCDVGFGDLMAVTCSKKGTLIDVE